MAHFWLRSLRRFRQILRPKFHAKAMQTAHCSQCTVWYTHGTNRRTYRPENARPRTTNVTFLLSTNLMCLHRTFLYAPGFFSLSFQQKWKARLKNEPSTSGENATKREKLRPFSLDLSTKYIFIYNAFMSSIWLQQMLQTLVLAYLKLPDPSKSQWESKAAAATISQE